MLKKVIHSIVVGSLVLAAQAASADSNQFLIDGRYQGVADLPFPTSTMEAQTDRPATPLGQPQEQRVRPEATESVVAFPAPYDMGSGYFN